MSGPFQVEFPRAYPEPVGSGRIKCCPQDFVVDEALSFPFTGEGEHVYLKIRKTGQNTLWVVGLLCKHFAVKQRDVGYAGLKDRHGVTTQWFSLLAKSARPDKIESFSEEGIEILDVQRHSGKLRKGAIKFNRFKIMLREMNADKKEVEKRIQYILNKGVPNYFDEQRFGRQHQNLIAAQKMFSGGLCARRPKQRIYISAARSWLFNLVLAERVRGNNWSNGLEGDVFMLDGSKTFFHEGKISQHLVQRLKDRDIHPTAPLWGRGDIQTSSQAKDFELNVLVDWREWCLQMENAGMKQQRRATRVLPARLEYDYNAEQVYLAISFDLPAGSYATNLLRELVSLK